MQHPEPPAPSRPFLSWKDIAGLQVVEAAGDGNCLFNAVAIALAANGFKAAPNAQPAQERTPYNVVISLIASQLRAHTVTILRQRLLSPEMSSGDDPWRVTAAAEIEEFNSKHVTAALSIEDYITRLAMPGEYATGICVAALSDFLQCSIYIWQKR